MYSAKVLSSDHLDLIHDVAFNWYGTHLATCSSDQTVKVWTWDKQRNSWSCAASWKSHSGAVWKVTWAHPEFGQVLATCSFDRTASVWEEVPGEPTAGSSGAAVSNSHSSFGGGRGSDSTGGNSHWVKRTSLVDSRTSVTDVKFSPRGLGLLLATCSSDGTVRIYEAPDVMNLSQWSLQHEIPCRVSCSCISWNNAIGRNVRPMIAVGSDDPNPSNGGKVLLFEYHESTRRWMRVETLTSVTDAVHDLAFAPNVGRSYSLLAVAASKDLRIVTLKPDETEPTALDAGSKEAVTRYEIRLAGQFNEHASSVWRVCWNVTGTVLASSGDDGTVRLWKCDYRDGWRCVASLRGDAGSGLSKDTEFQMPAAVIAAMENQQQQQPIQHAGNKAQMWH